MENFSYLLKRFYRDFNDRNVEGLLERLDENVVWVDRVRAGNFRGREALRDHWTQFWSAYEVRIRPLSFRREADGTIRVDAHELAKTDGGDIAVQQVVRHVFCVSEEGAITRFEIENVGEA